MEEFARNDLLGTGGTSGSVSTSSFLGTGGTYGSVSTGSMYMAGGSSYQREDGKNDRSVHFRPDAPMFIFIATFRVPGYSSSGNTTLNEIQTS